MIPHPRILHVDADAFFAAVARLVDPEGAGKARFLIVGGSRGSRGVVCSASWEAREFGVRSAMSIARAEKLCPQAMFVPVPGKACGIKSKEIRAALQKFTPVVEGASVDEWYLDMAGTEAVYHNEPLRVTAHRIRSTVRKETGMSISIGGGTNKLVSKMAVERAKPKPGTTGDGVHIVEPGTEAEFLRTFNLADIPMVGPKFQVKLSALGMVTVPDLLEHDLVALRRMLGTNAAEWLWDRAHGIAGAVVEGHGDQKSMSRDETFSVDLSKDEDIERELLRLVTRASHDLRQAGFTARTITVKLRDKDFKTRSARRTLVKPVVADRVIMETAKDLLHKLRGVRRVPARLIGVALSSLAADVDADQLNLFDNDDPQLQTDRDLAIARTVDRVRKKFGSKGIIPGALVETSER
ncbi:MAG: Y-family DNA polymerase [Bryobacteraceae bacterium]